MNYGKEIRAKKIDCLYEGVFGLEKENIRVDEAGNIATTPHPKVFGDKRENPYITVDFGESQVEIITPPFDAIDKAYNCMVDLNDIVAGSLENEYLWPQSMPPRFKNEDNIEVAKFPEGSPEFEYRKHLVEAYGKKRQLLSGIHFNFSFDEKLIYGLYDSSKGSFRDFQNRLYLHVVRNFHRYSYLLPCLFGASNAYLKEFGGPDCELETIKPDEIMCRNMVSYRNSKDGYQNKSNFWVDYSSLDNYHESLDRAIAQGTIKSAREFYAPIRLKAKSGNDLKTGIDYLEVRVIDLNPFIRSNVDINDLYYLHLFLIFCLVKPSIELNPEKFELFKERFANMAANDSYHQKSLNIHQEIKKALADYQQMPEQYRKALEIVAKRCKSQDRHIDRYTQAVKEKGYLKFNLGQAKRFKDESLANYGLIGYGDLELSTQLLIKGAIRRGLKIEMVDRRDNFIRISSSKHEQYVKQATKTGLDSYMTYLIMENKIASKYFMEKAGIKTPSSLNFASIDLAKAAYNQVSNKKIVIKPRSTNFGLGISIFDREFDRSEYEIALNNAFDEDSEVLIEDFITGKEYRFLVIGDEVAAILHRKNASVIGDGVATVSQLISRENQNPLRGENYNKPLQKIKVGPIEKQVLTSQNLNLDSVPGKNQEVILRDNSNISTGGTSIDYTDVISSYHKDIAVKAARAVDARICGVDMIIPDLKRMNMG